MYSKNIKKLVEEMLECKHLPAFTRKNKSKVNELIQATTFLKENAKISERIFCVHNNISKIQTCLGCNKKITFNNAIKQYSKYCKVCVQKFTSARKKAKETTLKKYGVENYAQTKEFIKKFKQTNLEKYGVENYAQTMECQEKMKKTNLERYGVENYSSSIECRKKVKQTNLERYGVEYYTQTEQIKEKAKQTNLEKYGVEYYQQKHISQESLDKLNDKDWLYEEHVIKQKSLIQISDELNVSQTLSGKYLKRYDIETQYFKTSLEEKELSDYISSLTTNVITNTRSIIPPLELDIYLPDYQLAFEYNGLYWHSHLVKQDKFYHINKTNACKQQRIKLIHIFEHEWLFKQDIVKSKINSLLGLNQVIYSSECQIKEISYKESQVFFNRTHIQGNATSEIQIGLFHEDQLVSVMTFGKSKFNNKYELLRFGSELNINVVGGAYKLFKYFIQQYKPESIISYNDFNWGIDSVYDKLGFKFSHISLPNYFYFKGYEIITRNQCQKHKLKENFNPDLTEYQNMLNHDWDKIYNCGNSVWIYHFNTISINTSI